MYISIYLFTVDVLCCTLYIGFFVDGILNALAASVLLEVCDVK